jgi:predicted DsbA family dithiol-disulfide isomerase
MPNFVFKYLNMKVEIWSDVVCPFCYIGKRKFEAALSKFSHKDEIEVIWHSFQLAPDMEFSPGKSLNDWLAEKKGMPVQQAKEMNNHVAKMAAEVGLKFNFDSAKPANTFDAHRLIHLAGEHNLQGQAKERLLSAYFTEGLNISDDSTLVKLGEGIGLKKKEIEEMLAGDKEEDEVKADIQEADAIGINGVPFFIFNRKYAISGAQSPETFLRALEKSWAEWKKESSFISIPDVEGETCKPGEPC